MATDAVHAHDERPRLALPLQLDLDRRAVTETFLLRAVACTITVFGSLWLIAAQRHGALVVIGVLACGFALLWLWRGLRERGNALQAGHHLLLDRDGIALCQANKITQRAWRDVRAVRVDEDRLVVLIEGDDPAHMTIEPNYGGLGVYALRDVIEDARRCANGDADASTIERG